MTELWNRPGARWRRLPRGRASQLVVHHRRPAHAWAVLGRGRVTALRASGAVFGASMGGYLLSCLNAALAPLVSHEDGPALWVVPVNMRGAVRRRRALSNHLSFLPVRLREHDGPRTATRLIRARLDDGSHWLFHLAGQVSSTVDLPGPSITMFADQLRGRSVGLFSNLGSWQLRGLDEETAWVFCPPVTRFLPLSAGVIVVSGSLGLMLQAYPSLTMRDDEVRDWLEAWIDQLDRQIDSRA